MQYTRIVHFIKCSFSEVKEQEELILERMSTFISGVVEEPIVVGEQEWHGYGERLGEREW